MKNAANGIGSGVTGSKIARLGEKGKKVVIAISTAALMACSGGGGDDHSVVAAEPTTPVSTVPNTPNVPSTPVETCTPGDNTVTVEQGGSISFNLYSDDVGPCRIDNQDRPKNGTLTNITDGFVTYTPNPGFTGTDTFTVTYKDGHTSTVTVNVVAAADPVPTSAPIGTITTWDKAGWLPITITLPPVVDSLGRTVNCTITGLPPSLTQINNTTMTGLYDALLATETFPINRNCEAGPIGNPLNQTGIVNIANEG